MSARRDPFNEGETAAAARRRRSLGIALLCLLFMALVFSVTAVKLKQNTAAKSPHAAGSSGAYVE